MAVGGEGTCVVTGGVIRDWEGLDEATVNAVMVVVESATVGIFFLNGFGVQ